MDIERAAILKNFDDILEDDRYTIATASGAGRKKKKSSKAYERLGSEIDPEFINQYIDDGSLAYQKIKSGIKKKLAVELYGSDKPSAIVALGEKDVEKVMKKLRKARALEIEKAKEDYLKAEKVYMKTKALAKKEKHKADLDMIVNSIIKNEKQNEILYPKTMKIKKEFGLEPIPESMKIPEAELDLVSAYKGAGRKKRPLTAYQKFVRDFAKSHPGPNMIKRAAAAWNK